MDKLPANNWLTATLEELAKFIDYRGKTPKKTPSGIPLITAKNIRDGFINREPREYIALDAYDDWMVRGIPRIGDVVITTEAPMGNVASIDIKEKFALAQRAICLQPYEPSISKFLEFFLRSNQFKEGLTKSSTGTTVKGIKAANLKKLPIFIPPLAEQKVIAEKLDTLLAQVESTKARLEDIPVILKQFRQSVLAAAVSGELTEDWRKSCKTMPVKEEIERNNELKKGLLKVRKKSGWDADIELGVLPLNWSWIENHNLATDHHNSICAGPFGTIFKAKDFRDSGIPIIFLRHVKEGAYNQNKPNFMDEGVWEELHQEYSVYGGELLVTKLGDPPGESCIYPDNLGVSMVTPDVLKMKVDEKVANKKYLMHFFNSPISRKMVGEAAFGATRLRIDIALFKRFPIPLPPTVEQKEIVRRVEELFTFATKIETKAKTALENVNHLTQSILAQAFSGELTNEWREQNPDLISGENSAEALLERIKDERAKLKPVKKTVRRKKVSPP